MGRPLRAVAPDEVAFAVSEGNMRARVQLDLGSLATTGELLREHRARGIEDWFYFASAPATESVAYEVELDGVAGMRLVERVLELVDAGGAPRLRMAAPWILDRAGTVHPVQVELEACVADRDPRAPWGRAPTAPGGPRCEVRLRWSLSPELYPAWLDPFWTDTRSMTLPRALHTATLLEDGRVLVVGGNSDVEPELASAELFDPATETFAATGSLSQPRRAHRAVRLDDDRVLVVAGDRGVGVVTSIATLERYDASSGLFTSLGDASVIRGNPSVTKLADGRVLIAGGWSYGSSQAFRHAEICSGSGEACGLIGLMLEPRAAHTATLLADGRVLVAGGGTQIYVEPGVLSATTELLDPISEAWTPGPALAVARTDHVAVALPSGDVAFVAGSAGPSGGAMLSSVEIFRAESESVVVGGSLLVPRWLHSATILPSRSVLVTGTSGPYFTESAVVLTEIYDPSTGGSKAAGALPQPAAFQTATLLADGRVLVAGGAGQGSNVRDSVALFGDPLGSPCVSGDASSCPNGVCLSGVCSAAPEPQAGGGGMGGGDAVGGAGGADDRGRPADEGSGRGSFYACSAASRRSAPDAAPVSLLLALSLVVRRATRSGSSRARGRVA